MKKNLLCAFPFYVEMQLVTIQKNVFWLFLYFLLREKWLRVVPAQVQVTYCRMKTACITSFF